MHFADHGVTRDASSERCGYLTCAFAVNPQMS
jgi:hypothetical protein